MTKKEFIALCSVGVCVFGLWLVWFIGNEKAVRACWDNYEQCRANYYASEDLYKNFIAIRNNKIFKKVYKFWKLYHLNDMHAGTIEQEKNGKIKGINTIMNPFVSI